MFVEADYSGAEVRTSVCYHHDERMRTYVEDPTTDMHRDVAMQIFMLDEFDKKIPGHKLLRQVAKNGFVFPQFYGSYYANCARNMAVSWCKLPQHKEWKSGDGVPFTDSESIGDHLIKNGITNFIEFTNHVQEVEEDFWENRFSAYNAWKTKNWMSYQRKGYVDMYTGFRCSGLMKRTEVNNIAIQGSAFHCLLWAFIAIDRWIRKNRLKTRLVLQIHDALLLDVPEKEYDLVIPMVKDIMCNKLRENWKWIDIPFDVEFDLCPVDGSWNERLDAH
jgi:DNA polymerase I-like protein with 3'-5' exonuclease and polymerase domains